jgi:carbonic anhydrase
MKSFDALNRLIEGNKRFVSGAQSNNRSMTPTDRSALVKEQNPFAIILGCSDSRVPAELVFDQGLGDLFVIRVAGNIVSPSQIGSVEFAAERFGTPLVVVLGHSFCGAIEAAIEGVGQSGGETSSPNMNSIVSRIRPCVENLLELHVELSDEELFHQAVRANIRASADHLRHGSQTLERLIAEKKLLVVGAEYSLETGEVEFFDGMP